MTETIEHMGKVNISSVKPKSCIMKQSSWHQPQRLIIKTLTHQPLRQLLQTTHTSYTLESFSNEKVSLTQIQAEFQIENPIEDTFISSISI